MYLTGIGDRYCWDIAVTVGTKLLSAIEMKACKKTGCAVIVHAVGSLRKV